MANPLNIPEVILIVFSYLDQSSNARNARVCKLWSEIALDAVWHKIDNLPMILPYLPSQGPAPPRQYFLTCNVLLALNRDLTCCLLFMSPTVTELDLSLHPQDSRHFHGLVEDVVDRMPRIARLRFKTSHRHIHHHYQVDDLRRLFESLLNLKDIALPWDFLHQPVVQRLSRLAHVENLWIEATDTKDHRSHPSLGALQADAFPSLRQVALSVPIDRSTTLLTRTNFPSSNLTTLYVYLPFTRPRNKELGDFFVTLASACPALEYFELIVSKKVSVNSVALTYQDVSFITRFPKLTSFTIRDEIPILMTDKDMESLASSLPRLECLILNTHPLLAKEPTLTLRALIPFARYCPNLTRLGLYIDAQTIVSLPSNDLAFNNLTLLDMGISSRCPDLGDERSFDTCCPLSVHDAPKVVSPCDRRRMSMEMGTSQPLAACA
ncbi:hypothetical protein EW146_g3381 [Bondarzewia mesenterica]|uniref:F-box domain-containing protein n=1 Tax=Bondarzewia mesenterica TaxID=1095465 RepID=A0A4S4LY07_9AGAM|nr:hypothetical protein EW146_g3381 [Bondarzewia mesenterica]